jgi:hypothetical protein
LHLAVDGVRGRAVEGLLGLAGGIGIRHGTGDGEVIVGFRRAGDSAWVAFTKDGTRQIVLDTGPITASVGELVTVVLGENPDQSPRVDVVRE